MNIISIAGFGIVAAIICIILKQYKPEYALMVSLIAGITVLLLAANSIKDIFEKLNVMLGMLNVSSEYTKILVKSLGICFVTQVACDSCKDIGENAIASKVEIAGKISVLIISLPLFEKILSIVADLLE